MAEWATDSPPNASGISEEDAAAALRSSRRNAGSGLGEAEFAAARRAEIITRDITAEQLAAPVKIVDAGPRTETSPAQNREAATPMLRALAVTRTTYLGEVRISSQSRRHFFNDTRNPDDWRVLSVLPQLLHTARALGKPHPQIDNPRQLFQPAVALVRMDGNLLPVRLTLRMEGGQTYLHALDVLHEKATPVGKYSDRATPESAAQANMPTDSVKVADILPDVKPQPDGTSTAAFAQKPAPTGWDRVEGDPAQPALTWRDLPARTAKAQTAEAADCIAMILHKDVASARCASTARRAPITAPPRRPSPCARARSPSPSTNSPTLSSAAIPRSSPSAAPS